MALLTGPLPTDQVPGAPGSPTPQLTAAPSRPGTECAQWLFSGWNENYVSASGGSLSTRVCLALSSSWDSGTKSAISAGVQGGLGEGVSFGVGLEGHVRTELLLL